MKFHILTLFPEMVMNGLNTSIIGRAAAQGLLSIQAVNIRDYTMDKHGKVDDYPYGGGAGMLMQAQPVFDAYQAVVRGMNAGKHITESAGRKVRTIYVTPQGRQFTQQMAKELADEEELVFLCGHYEGIDERVLEEIVTDYVSIGDYVLTGGELPAMVMIDAISRLIPGVLNNGMSAETESFHNDLLEYPQYTRPENWHDKKVPEVLLSGNHKNIVKWRLEWAKEKTASRRPDLYIKYQEKQKAIQALSKRKREHIHIMEHLFRGDAMLLFRKGEDCLVYDPNSQSYIMTVSHFENIPLMIDMLPKEAKKFVVNQAAWTEPLEKKFGALKKHVLLQACYTRKEPLPVKHKDIRCLDSSCFQDVAECCEEDDGYLKERLEKGRLFGAFDADQLCGWIGIHDDGRMGMLYVKERYRGQGIAKSLEAWLINRLLEMGMTPYTQVSVDNKEILGLQERLGLYLSSGNIYRLYV